MLKKINHKIYKVFKKIKKYTNKFLAHKIQISTMFAVLIICGVLIGGICIIHTLTQNKNKYRYEDIYNETGNSSSCIKKEDGYYCLTYTKVNWYFEK